MTWIFESLYALELKHLDEVWEICQWRRGELAQAYFGSLPPLRVDAVYLADLHFRGITVSELPLSPRLAAFVSSVRHLGVWREGIMLACLLECGACTFDPKLVIPDVEKNWLMSVACFGARRGGRRAFLETRAGNCDEAASHFG